MQGIRTARTDSDDTRFRDVSVCIAELEENVHACRIRIQSVYEGLRSIFQMNTPAGGCASQANAMLSTENGPSSTALVWGESTLYRTL